MLMKQWLLLLSWSLPISCSSISKLQSRKMLIGTIALCLFHNWLVLSIHINSFEKSSKFSLSNCMEILFLFSFFSLVDNGNGYQCIISQGDKTSYR